MISPVRLEGATPHFYISIDIVSTEPRAGLWLPSTASVKDKEGYLAFALVNKATSQAIKHSLGPRTEPPYMYIHTYCSLINPVYFIYVKNQLTQFGCCHPTRSNRMSRCCGRRARTSATASAASGW
ncbi:Os10g0168751 [Oryza sativa Japonica Group]|uniref:Os10g0168751 protein n=1 Tax=Oryza sativa subsp. japonica TaxID=39947 RepID=A0A0P0XS38_ORYSJ|nr:Os10g0168751 [Oryza sativa Japonica Group]